MELTEEQKKGIAERKDLESKILELLKGKTSYYAKDVLNGLLNSLDSLSTIN